MDSDTKNYLDIQFTQLKESIKEMKQNVIELYNGRDENVKNIIKMQGQLESGNKKFQYVEREIDEVKSVCAKCNNSKDIASLKFKTNIIWGGVGILATGLVLAVSAALIKLL